MMSQERAYSEYRCVPIVRIEIDGGLQVGPARLTGATGIRFDYSNSGRMIFWVVAVDADGGRETLQECARHDSAVIEAEQASRDYAVPVHDLVDARA